MNRNQRRAARFAGLSPEADQAEETTTQPADENPEGTSEESTDES